MLSVFIIFVKPDEAMSENGEKPGEGPPAKKIRFEEDVEGMRSQLSFLTNLLPRFLPQGPQVIPTQNEEPQSTPLLELGECSTTIDEKKISQVATEERVSQVNFLQHFESSEWKEVRYSEALKKLVCTPGFTELKVNNELCYLDKGKDTFLSADRVMAGLTHVLLDQRDNIKYIMADLIDWIIENQAVLTKEDLTKVVTDNFGAGSTIFNNFEQALQVICGKRAECIENRRERILAGIPVKKCPGDPKEDSTKLRVPLCEGRADVTNNFSRGSTIMVKPSTKLDTEKYLFSPHQDQDSSLPQNRVFRLEAAQHLVNQITTLTLSPSRTFLEPKVRIPFAGTPKNDYMNPQIFSGGQLVKFLGKWQELGAPEVILKMISGYHIPFADKPSLNPHWKSSRFKTTDSSEMREQIELLKAQGFLESPKNLGPSFISQMFLVKKSDGS